MAGTATFLGGGTFTGKSFTTASTTRFLEVSSNHLNVPTATEADCQLITRKAGNFSRIGIRITVAASTNDGTFRLRVDTGGGGANGNNAVTLVKNVTGWYEDATPHNDTVASGDKICLGLTSGAGTVSFTYVSALVKFLASTSGAASYYGVSAPDSLTTYTLTSNTVAARTYNTPLSGGNALQGPNLENANQRQKIRTAGVFSRLQTKVNANAITNASTFIVRINNADGTGVASITASTTGVFEDVTNSDSLNATDVVVFAWKLAIEGTSHNATVKNGFGMFVPSSSGWDIFASNGTTADTSGSTSVTNFYNIVGTASRFTTESQAQIKIPFAVTLSYLRCYVAVSQTGTLTMTLHKNTSAVNQTLSLTSATTGAFEDTSNTDAVADGDALNYSHGAMVSTSGFWLSLIAMKADPGSGVVPGNGTEVHHYNTVILG